MAHLMSSPTPSPDSSPLPASQSDEESKVLLSMYEQLRLQMAHQFEQQQHCHQQQFHYPGFSSTYDRGASKLSRSFSPDESVSTSSFIHNIPSNPFATNTTNINPSYCWDYYRLSVFPTSNYVYVGMQNDSLQTVVSNGQVDYDHAYQAPTPLSPLIIGSGNGRQQQTQTSPNSATVTATATASLFDNYHSQRHSFSDCTT